MNFVIQSTCMRFHLLQGQIIIYDFEEESAPDFDAPTFGKRILLGIFSLNYFPALYI